MVRVSRTSVPRSFIAPQLEQFRLNAQQLALIVFGRGSGPRILMVKPDQLCGYNRGSDTVKLKMDLASSQINSQIFAVLHEFRHRIVVRGRATPYREFKALQPLVTHADIVDLRQRIAQEYLSPKYSDTDRANELDACLVALAGVRLIERAAKPEQIRAMLHI